MDQQREDRTISAYDRMMGSLVDRPDVVHSKPSTIRTINPLIGQAQTFILQTFRESAEDKPSRRDTMFIEYMGPDGSIRMFLPAEAANAIARQRDALSTKIRRKHGKRIAEERKAAGIKPGFMKHKKAGVKK